MKTVLVTGVSGFVGPYLGNELESNGYKVVGVDRSGGTDYQADILDKEQLQGVVRKVAPDYICHLAGFSSVKDSFDNPDLCRKINVHGTRNLLDAVEDVNSKAKVLIISSSHVYGKPEYNPIDEKHSLNPDSPYGESRVEQEALVLDSGLDVVISRSFNHTGPGQQLGFVCSDLINEVKCVKNGESDCMMVGNLTAKRDISDVRDVVRAYRILLEKGEKGHVYNVCSGKSTAIRDILDAILDIAGVGDGKVEQDPNRIRPSDVPEMYGDNSKIKGLGWKPEFVLRRTLEDMWEAQ